MKVMMRTSSGPLKAFQIAGRLITLCGLLAMFNLPVAAQGLRTCGNTSLGLYQWVANNQYPRSNNCQGGFRCYPAENTGYSVEKADPLCSTSGGGPCAVRIHATARIPGLADMINQNGLFSSLTPWTEWYPCAGAACAADMVCGLDAFGGRINFDDLDNWLATSLTCGQALSMNLSVKIRVCAGSACERASNNKVIDIPGIGLALGLGCPLLPVDDCSTNTNQCRDCRPAGGGCSFSVEGKVSCEFSGHGAAVRYRAGGAGGNAFPGTPAWRTALGLYISHPYAQRVVMDPDINHVWLITEGASFREFRNPAVGTGLRLYDPTLTAPSDEYRKLSFDTTTGGWQLDSLDGRKEVFRADGLWEKTVFARDPTHPVQSSYAGSQLQSVSFPDGRQETFTYSPSGKLASITEIGVGGSTSRTWAYVWSGDELAYIGRPDGTHWELNYDPALNGGRPGYLTLLRLVGTDGTGRIEAAFEYDAFGNVVKAWRGDPSFSGPQAIDKQTLAYTNPALPSQTVATRTVSDTFDQVTTYAIGRDTRSTKLRVTSIQGSCPVCGLSPITSFTYGASQPLLPASATDAKGTRTDYTYNANGRVVTKVEAANVPSLTRTTTYTYDANFPGLGTRVEVPSTSGGSNKRRTDSAYDPTTSVLTTRTIDGFEKGVALPAGFRTTAYTYNASGEALTRDPPGFGTADVTSFTYNLAGRNGHVVDSRTDPLVGTTTFAYDGLNRRTSVIDPNNVETVTSYENLSRVTEVRQKNTPPGTPSDLGDLVTTYTYNPFGDLFCTKLPRGNGIEYAYDFAGRLTEVIRGTVVASPTSTVCLDTTLSRERTAYKLDGAGHRIEESLERWTGSAWVSDSKTAYQFTCQLDRTTQGAGSSAPSVTEYCHDVNENLERVWDANHPKASSPNPTQLYSYDALNRLITVTVGLGTVNAAASSYTYDVQDHLASVTDAEGNQTTYATSDRDLMTQEVSPVSGSTLSTYNEHGKRDTTTDARSIVTTRTLDAADRVTQVTYGLLGSSDASLTTTYAYGATPDQFDVGRLTSIARNGQAILYTHDRFGRVLRDGALTYSYDKNGNRSGIGYPGGVLATYTHDSSDREATLTFDSVAGSQPLVTGASYKARGPLTTLAFANGLIENRLFDQRYIPANIEAGSLLDLNYVEDALGNPLQISGNIIGKFYSETFSYQDPQYFLTQGNGPWGMRSWTYDRIGNRLTNSEDGGPTQTYTYAGSGHSPRLSQIAPASGIGGGSLQLAYDAAGNQISVQQTDSEGSIEAIFLDASPESRLSALRSSSRPGRSDMIYDGRGLLREASLTFGGSPEFVRVKPEYTSEGLLLARTEERTWSGSTAGPDGEDSSWLASNQETAQIFYFAGRPVAQLMSGPELVFLTTDHIGAPVLVTSTTGAVVWAGGLEPFGRIWTAGGNLDPEPSSASAQHNKALSRLPAESVLIRYPGQWESDVFRVDGVQFTISYNVYRWYEPQTGRYSQPDPLGSIKRGSYPFVYADSNPERRFDPKGLDTAGCDTPGIRFITELTSCGRRCCARHDACYAQYGCTDRSWPWNDPFGECFPLKCTGCNAAVVVCQLACFQNPFLSPAVPTQYYCAAQSRFVRIPEDFPDQRTARANCEFSMERICCHGDPPLFPGLPAEMTGPSW